MIVKQELQCLALVQVIYITVTQSSVESWLQNHLEIVSWLLVTEGWNGESSVSILVPVYLAHVTEPMSPDPLPLVLLPLLLYPHLHPLSTSTPCF